jgi:hypothetical protein
MSKPGRKATMTPEPIRRMTIARAAIAALLLAAPLAACANVKPAEGINPATLPHRVQLPPRM